MSWTETVLSKGALLEGNEFYLAHAELQVPRGYTSTTGELEGYLKPYEAPGTEGFYLLLFI